MSARRYYATQFGYVWSMTRDAMARFLTRGATGYSLAEYGRELRGVWRTRTETGARTVPARFAGAFFVDPLDWDPEDFADARGRLREESKTDPAPPRVTTRSLRALLREVAPPDWRYLDVGTFETRGAWHATTAGKRGRRDPWRSGAWRGDGATRAAAMADLAAKLRAARGAKTEVAT